MIDVQVRLFGAYRKFGDGRHIQVQVPVGITVEEFRSYLGGEIIRTAKAPFDPLLLSETAFANEQRVLSLEDRIEQNCTLAALPPVCGG